MNLSEQFTRKGTTGRSWMTRRITSAFLVFFMMWATACSFEEIKITPEAPVVGSAPTTPTDVAAVPGNKQATLQWKTVTGATSYRVYWSNTQGVSPSTGKRIDNVQSPHMHTGLTNGVTYYYVITAANVYGESGKSTEVAVTLNSAPSVPTGVVATRNERQVVISWNSVDKATSYNLYWSQVRGVSQANGTKIAGVSSPYVHAGLASGATYYYVVTAVNAYGESGNSIEVAIKLGDAPAAPTGVTAIYGDGLVRVSWNSVEEAETYNVYWTNEPAVQISGSAKIEGVTSPYSHEGLRNGSPYYYVITAVNTFGESSLSQEVYAIPHTNFIDASKRVVWVQDMGEGRDVDAQGGNLRLMGLDSRDSRGERAILETIKNYAKPLITPRGDRVVFSDRTRKSIYVVNWDGSGLRELRAGLGLAVWRDPRDGREWIYYGSEEMRDGGPHCPAVYRTLLDSPGAGELVWNQAPVSVDSFQLSADGRMAGVNVPWPVGGVAELPNRSLTRLGSGCWTALAPDNSYAFWVFDSPHRNLYIDDISGEQGRWVNINGAPGIDGYEVYHPRWSNHPRYMVMTGPYKVGTGPNRIAGGGREVEIYVGRFDANYTAIESWWRVTNNNLGDFFPDVWISP
jgi:fibronectin type 3 domain-containing protein